MTWNQILERAATETGWQWYHPNQMDALRKTCLNQDKWREIGGYIKKGPFEKEPTEVSIEQLSYDEKANEFTLKVRGVHGTTVYYDVGAEPSTASAVACNPFVTKETDLWFLCVDNSKENPLHRLGLHHYQIIFTDPITQKVINISKKAPKEFYDLFSKH